MLSPRTVTSTRNDADNRYDSPLMALWGFGSLVYDQDTGATEYALTNPDVWYALYTHALIRFSDFLFGCLLSERFVRHWEDRCHGQRILQVVSGRWCHPPIDPSHHDRSVHPTRICLRHIDD
jgi:hypothetical protein